MQGSGQSIKEKVKPPGRYGLDRRRNRQKSLWHRWFRSKKRGEIARLTISIKWTIEPGCAAWMAAVAKCGEFATDQFDDICRAFGFNHSFSSRVSMRQSPLLRARQLP